MRTLIHRRRSRTTAIVAPLIALGLSGLSGYVALSLSTSAASAASVTGVTGLTAANTQPHPVAPSTHRVALSGVDSVALVAAPPAFAPAAVRAAKAKAAATGPGTADTAPGTRTSGADKPVLFTRQIATGRFTAAGLSWSPQNAPSDVVVQMRLREGGRWGDWQVLETSEQPESGSAEARSAAARISTEPVSTGSADAVQVRLDASGGAPRDVSLLTVDPGTSAADSAVRGTLAPAAKGVAERPTIISRAQWGADESLLALHGPCPGYSATVRVGFVHHTVGSNSYTAAQSASIMRGIYAYHVQGNGWCDIGYNFLVDRYGQIFEGRHGGVDRPVIGAHTLAFNRESFAVSAMGTFSTATPPAAMTQSIAAVLGWKLSMFGRDPRWTDVLTSSGGAGARWPEGTSIRFNDVSGHRDAYATECPGTNLYSRLPALRSAAAAFAESHEVRRFVPATLNNGGAVWSSGGRYQVTMQVDGNLVVYNSAGVATWSTRTFVPNSVLTVQSDGNVVISEPEDGFPLWSPRIVSPGATLEIQDDGNLVLYSRARVALWDALGHRSAVATRWIPRHAFTHLSPGQSIDSYDDAYHLTMQTWGELTVTDAEGKVTWSSGTRVAGSRLEAQSDGNMVIYNPAGTWIWKSGTLSRGAQAVIQDDGAVVIYDVARRPIWSSLTST